MITPLYTISGRIIATEVSQDEFMLNYPELRVEWVDGVVIEMPGIDEQHDALTGFLRKFLETYLELTGGGRVLQDPMLMRLPGISTRAPDIQVLLPDSLHKLQKNEVAGAADLVIEIVSEGSQRIDRHNKFLEYERGGVPEYWILDWQYEEALFYQRDENGQYQRQRPEENGIYHSHVLPEFQLAVTLLWQRKLPGVLETVRLIQEMLKKDR